MTDRPKGLDDLLDYVAERTDPVDMARIWYEELAREETAEATARRLMVGALLKVIDDQAKDLARYRPNSTE